MTYGNLINEHSWLYDRKAAMKITVNGQLMLLMLIERLTENECKVISANTDGITAIVPKKKEETYYKICQDWEKLTLMNLEFVEYEKIIFYAVNDYIAVKRGFNQKIINSTKSTSLEVGLPKVRSQIEKEYLKEKGLFISNARIGKGLSPLVIATTLKNYFLYGSLVHDLVHETDIRMFLMSEKTGRQWTVEYNNEVQQRVNRFYASKKGLYLFKWKFNDDGSKEYQNMLSGSPVKLLNSLDLTKDIDSYDINYSYYMNECSKIIEEIDSRQMKLF